MMGKIKILFINTVLFVFLSMSYTNAAFDGNYTFSLESATQVEINAIITPQEGMMVYNITSNKINYYNGTAWVVLSAEGMYGTNAQLTGDREVDLNTNNLGFINGNTGIGDATPDATLDVAGSFRLDGVFQDKDGDNGTSGQALTSTGTGTDWTSSVSAPNISSNTIVISASTTTTITIVGSNFIPTSAVIIPGFNGTINSINVASPTQIEVDITTGAAATFDIVISNNGVLNTQWAGNGVGLLVVN